MQVESLVLLLVYSGKLGFITSSKPMNSLPWLWKYLEILCCWAVYVMVILKYPIAFVKLVVGSVFHLLVFILSHCMLPLSLRFTHSLFSIILIIKCTFGSNLKSQLILLFSLFLILFMGSTALVSIIHESYYIIWTTNFYLYL